MVMEKNICIICQHPTTVLMEGEILGKYTIRYYYCEKCKCVHTEKPYWISEAYDTSIAVTDTGIMFRNMEICRDVFAIIKRYFNPQVKVLDYGGGYGILTRMLRDRGVNVYWFDKYSENLLAKGFEYDGIAKMDILLAFEVVEHLENPMEAIREIMSKCDCFIFSVLTLLKFNFQTNKEWWYFAPETGQHIFFPSTETLEYIAKEIGCKYYKINDLHIFSTKKKFRIIGRLDVLFCYYFRMARRKFFSSRKFVSKIWEDNSTMKNKLMNDRQTMNN